MSTYCTISIVSSITCHRGLWFGRILSPVLHHNPPWLNTFREFKKWSKKAILKYLQVCILKLRNLTGFHLNLNLNHYVARNLWSCMVSCFSVFPMTPLSLRSPTTPWIIVTLLSSNPSASVFDSVLRSSSVWFFAPKTGNRGPQLVQDQQRYWGDRTGPPRTGFLWFTQPK
jgi:hypothetical protein